MMLYADDFMLAAENMVFIYLSVTLSMLMVYTFIHVQQSTDEEAESFDFEYDTLKDVVYKDNLIYIYSEYDEELSRSFFENT